MPDCHDQGPAQLVAQSRDGVEDPGQCGERPEDDRGVHDQRVHWKTVELHASTLCAPRENSVRGVPDYTDDLRLAHVLADDADATDHATGSRPSTCTS